MLDPYGPEVGGGTRIRQSLRTDAYAGDDEWDRHLGGDPEQVELRLD
jgi:hypothetical protein